MASEMSGAFDEPVFSELGEAGLLCEYPTGPLAIERQQRIWMVAQRLRGLDGVRETVPGMNNLAILFDPDVLALDDLRDHVRAAWFEQGGLMQAPRDVVIPVIYGGADLVALAAAAGMSVGEFARLHAAGDYTVYALGSQPGFGYLGGLDPRLAAARRTEINPRVEAGCVIIGGAQTAVQAKTTPSGWHIIGRTEMSFFDPSATPPALLAPGDKVRFQIIQVQE